MDELPGKSCRANRPCITKSPGNLKKFEDLVWKSYTTCVIEKAYLYLSCPQCGAELKSDETQLCCVGAALHGYPIKNGVRYFDLSNVGAPTAPKQVSFAERIFDFPALYRMKSKYLGRLNGLGADMLVDVTHGLEVLDVGCGSHQYLYEPEKTKFRAGIDSSAPAIEAANRLYPSSFHAVGSVVKRMPFKDKSFDTVLLLFLLHHLPVEFVPGVLAEARRLSRKNIVILDHIRSDVPLLRAIQLRYWSICDGGTLYRSAAEWKELLADFKVREYRRSGALFRNVCYYVLEA